MTSEKSWARWVPAILCWGLTAAVVSGASMMLWALFWVTYYFGGGSIVWTALYWGLSGTMVLGVLAGGGWLGWRLLQRSTTARQIALWGSIVLFITQGLLYLLSAPFPSQEMTLVVLGPLPVYAILILFLWGFRQQYDE